MKPTKLYEQIAQAIQARASCAKDLDTHTEWFNRWSDRLQRIEKNVLPSGSGFDSGSKLDLDRSDARRIVITTAFHHMDENGSYCGWSEHTVWITPSFIGGFDVAVSGRNVRDIKDYIGEVFSTLLSEPYEFQAEVRS